MLATIPQQPQQALLPRRPSWLSTGPTQQQTSMDDATLLEQLVGSDLAGMLSSAPLATAAPSTVSKMISLLMLCGQNPNATVGFILQRPSTSLAMLLPVLQTGQDRFLLVGAACSHSRARSQPSLSHLWAMNISHASVNDPADTHLLALPGSWDPAHQRKVVQYEGWQARPLPRWLPGPALSCLHAFSSAWHPEAWELARTAAGNAAGQLSEMKGPS